MVKWNPMSRQSLVIASSPPSSEKAMYLRHLQSFATNIAARSEAMIQAEIAFGEQGVANRGTRGVGIYKGRPMSNTAIKMAKALAGKTHGGMSYDERLKDKQNDAGLRALQRYRRGGKAAGGREYA